MKKAIITLSILLIIVFSALLVLIFIKPGSKVDEELEIQEQEYLNGINNLGMLIQGEIPSKVINDNIYFTVEQCIKKYIEYVSSNNNVAIYSLLDYKYINEKNITQDNIKQYIVKYNNAKTSKIIEMYQLAGSKYFTYYIKQKMGEEYAYFTVSTDTSSNSFSVVPINKETYNQKISEPAKAFGNNEDTIKSNDYNTISYKYYEQEDIADKYLQDYLTNALLYPEQAYDTLNEEYKQRKFGSLEAYKQYIEKNKEKLQSMCKSLRKDITDFEDYQKYEEYFIEVSKNGLNQYKKEQNGENIQYILTDTYGATYIFKINSIMNYTLILDTYTIDLPEFTEKYEVATEEEKVLLNIEKVFQAINQADYQYVYNKLDATFKANNFATLQQFETYMNQNFYEKNKVSAGKAQKQNDIYMYAITINDATGQNQNTITKNFVMQLNQGTNFTMSFQV